MKKKKIIMITLGIIVFLVLMIATIYLYNKQRVLKQEKIRKDEINQEVDKYIEIDIETNATGYDQEGPIYVESQNQNVKFNQEKDFDGLIFQNIMLVKFDGTNVFEADIINNTGEDIEILKKRLILLDQEGKEIYSCYIAIANAKQGETKRVHAQFTDEKVGNDKAIEADDFIVKDVE